MPRKIIEPVAYSVFLNADNMRPIAEWANRRAIAKYIVAVKFPTNNLQSTEVLLVLPPAALAKYLEASGM